MVIILIIVSQECLGVEYIIRANIIIAIIVYTFTYTYVTLINKVNQLIPGPTVKTYLTLLFKGNIVQLNLWNSYNHNFTCSSTKTDIL